MNKSRLKGGRLAFYLFICIALALYGCAMSLKYHDITFAVFAIPLFALMMTLST